LRCGIADDYGGKFAEHAPRLLEAGYRIIVPDLPSHGRSTGLHAYVLNVSPFELDIGGRQRDALRADEENLQMEDVAAGVDAVICDVALKDMERAGKTEAAIDERKLFAAGSSMGGFTALLYALYVPGHCPLERSAACDMLRDTLR
jgi:acylglycerol lipase